MASKNKQKSSQSEELTAIQTHLASQLSRMKVVSKELNWLFETANEVFCGSFPEDSSLVEAWDDAFQVAVEEAESIHERILTLVRRRTEVIHQDAGEQSKADRDECVDL